MKRKNILDERVAAQRSKINSEAYGILMIVLMCSILIQQFLLKAPLEQYAAEFICFLVASVYIIARYFMLGLNIFGEGNRAKHIPFLISVVTGIVVTSIIGVTNYVKYEEHYKGNTGLFIAILVFTFISTSIIVYVMLAFLSYINMKKQAKIQKQLDGDEQDE